MARTDTEESQSNWAFVGFGMFWLTGVTVILIVASRVVLARPEFQSRPLLDFGLFASELWVSSDGWLVRWTLFVLLLIAIFWPFKPTRPKVRARRSTILIDKARQAKAETAKAETAKAETANAETANAETAKAETANAETANAETAKTAKAKTAKANAAKARASQNLRNKRYALWWGLGAVILLGWWQELRYRYYDFLPPEIQLSSIDVSKLLAWWSVALGALWLYNNPLPDRPDWWRTRVQHLLTWIVGLVLLQPIATFVLGAVAPTLSSPLAPLTEFVPFTAIWTTFALVRYIVNGDDSPTYRDRWEPYRAVWAVFAIVVLITFLVEFANYQVVRARVSSDLNAMTLARGRVEDLTASTSQLLSEARTMSERAGYAAASLQSTEALSSTLQEIQTRAPTLALHVSNARNRSNAATAAIQNALDAINSYKESDFTGNDRWANAVVPLGQVKEALEEVRDSNTSIAGSITPLSIITTTTSLPTTILSPPNFIPAGAFLSSRFADTEPLTAAEVQQFINIRLVGPAEDAHRSATIAAQSMNAIEPRSASAFIWVANLYSLFVLFPWLLLLVFLYRKRTSRAAQILDDLTYLDPSMRLLYRIIKGQKGKNPQNPGHEDQERGPDNPGEEQGESEADEVEISGTIESLRQGRLNDGSNTVLTHNIRFIRPIIDALAVRAFNNFEYILNLLFLTALTGGGWYYIFYPYHPAGLAPLIEGESGVRDVVAQIASNLTPLTLGFAGAYFYTMQMLVRRYLADDLYPSAFMQAAQRLMLVFILSLTLIVAGPFLETPNDETPPANGSSGQAESPIGGSTTITDTADMGAVITQVALNGTSIMSAVAVSTVAGVTGALMDRLASPALLLLAFFAGILPTWVLNWMSDQLGRRLRTRLPSLGERAPLTELDGMNLWTEARLHAENVENVQGLATAPVEHLVLRTNFPTVQIVDWIDQAILYSHCGNQGKWFNHLRAIGIRTASDLLDATGLKFHDARFTHLTDENHRATYRRVQNLVKAATEAHDPWRRIEATCTSLVDDVRTVSSLATRAHDEAQSLSDPSEGGEDFLEAQKEMMARLLAGVNVMRIQQTEVQQLLADDSEITVNDTQQILISHSLETLEQATEALRSSLSDARTLLDSLQESGISAEDVNQIQAAIQHVHESSQTLQEAGQGFMNRIVSVSMEEKLTEQILITICDSLWPDPNICYILNYHHQMSKCLSQPEPEEQPPLQLLAPQQAPQVAQPTPSTEPAS